jgi:CBS domain-containing protein
MQRVSEVMTRDVRFIAPQESLQRAAQLMDELNVGVLPVSDGERLVGMVTDRDIAIRGVAAGRAPKDAHVDEVMSTDVRWVFEDQPMEDVMIEMADSQIRRIPVVSHDDEHKLIGIVALGDVATKTSGGEQKQDVEDVLETVSSPSKPARASAGMNSTSGGAVASGIDTRTAPGVAGSTASGGTDTAGHPVIRQVRRRERSGECVIQIPAAGNLPGAAGDLNEFLTMNDNYGNPAAGNSGAVAVDSCSLCASANSGVYKRPNQSLDHAFDFGVGRRHVRFNGG